MYKYFNVLQSTTLFFVKNKYVNFNYKYKIK